MPGQVHGGPAGPEPRRSPARGIAMAPDVHHRRSIRRDGTGPKRFGERRPERASLDRVPRRPQLRPTPVSVGRHAKSVPAIRVRFRFLIIRLTHRRAGAPDPGPQRPRKAGVDGFTTTVSPYSPLSGGGGVGGLGLATNLPRWVAGGA